MLNPKAPEFTIHDLPRATPGSARLDLAASKDMIFSSTDGVQLIPTSVLSTLPNRVTRLLIRRSSNYKNEIKTLPRIIDSNFTRKIKVIVKSLRETVIIRKRQRIAQLLLLPYIKLPNPELQKKQSQEQFSSSDVVA